ncbi:MAG: hypothetical protein ACOH19_12320 [Rhodoglobus sp.]
MTEILAYPVPFTRERARGNLHRLKNASSETLRGITLTLHGAGMMSTSVPATLAPGEVLEVTIAGRDLARSTILVVRWFRPDDVEYLWRISF